MDPVHIKYHFTMEDGQQEEFTIQLDTEKIEVVPSIDTPLPDWTRLSYKQCSNCTLDPSKHAHCPPAVNMVDVVSSFDALLSHEETTVVVEAEERRIQTSTTVQRAISSLMGLLMAASGCPQTIFFKPMARYHWPFASVDETIWRAISAYLIAQYFHHLDGDPVDLQLKGLRQIYDNIQLVNMAFAKRLRKACHYDGMVNGIILLDMFAKSLPDAIDEALQEMKYLFVPFHQNEPPEGAPELA